MRHRPRVKQGRAVRADDSSALVSRVPFFRLLIRNTRRHAAWPVATLLLMTATMAAAANINLQMIFTTAVAPFFRDRM
jgi:hypothetical protein